MLRKAPPADLSISRLLLLFVLFFSICCGLGYPILNRIDWKQAPGGLEDVLTYARLVTSPPIADVHQHMQFRILVPYMARPFYRLAKGHIRTWDPTMFGLLVVNSFFVAMTAMMLVVVVCKQLGNYPIALGSALLYLLNFAIPNLRLAGLVDSSEGFFLLILVWTLLEKRYWMLLVWAATGATAKETFVPFLVVFTLAWWVTSRKELGDSKVAATWIAASWMISLTSLSILQWSITGVFRTPWRFGVELHGNSSYLAHFFASLRDRNLWYIFFWLLPLSLFRLNRLPRNWRFATAAGCAAAFAMDAYYGGAPGTIGRALFSVAGPLLSASAAIFLFSGVDTAAPSRQDVAAAVRAQDV